MESMELEADIHGIIYVYIYYIYILRESTSHAGTWPIYTVIDFRSYKSPFSSGNSQLAMFEDTGGD